MQKKKIMWQIFGEDCMHCVLQEVSINDLANWLMNELMLLLHFL